MNWKIGAALAAVGMVTFAGPAAAELPYQSVALHVPGDRGELIGCVGWQDGTGSNLVCEGSWRYGGQWVTLEDGSRIGNGWNDGPGPGAPMVGMTGCEHPGVVKVTFAVGDLDRTDGWEGRGSYRC